MTTPYVSMGLVLLGIGLVTVFGLITLLSNKLKGRTRELEQLKAQILEWNRRLEEKVVEKTKLSEVSLSQLETTYLETVTALIQAMYAKDPYLLTHSHNVANYAKAIAAELDLSTERMQRLSHGCELHDVGKIAIPDSILLKAGPLTQEEYEIVKQHPVWGARILGPLTFMKDISEMVHQEHERWDGTGYPLGLKGEQIILEARIISVADALDAMTSHRSYRKSVPLEEAVEELWRYAGTQFDARVVEACLRALKSGKLVIAHSEETHHVADKSSSAA